MRRDGTTPHRPGNSRLIPASKAALESLLWELDLKTPGPLSFKLVSEWAAKHVWRVDVGGNPWVYIRYLLGPAEQFPGRWRHMRMGELLHEAHVGPRILGILEKSESLDGRAVIVEAALEMLTRDELEDRADEAISLMTRLHSYVPLHEALSSDLTDADLLGFSPLRRLFAETRERWFEAVVPRWLAAGLTEINTVRKIVSELFNHLEDLRDDSERVGIVVPAHNDPNHGNFMINRRGALRMIDFEELSLNNPVADLGMFLTWYADVDQHRTLLEGYALADPDAMLERMRIWVPLKYLGIAAHWCARLPRSRDEAAWDYAVESIDEWLRGAVELAYKGPSPHRFERALNRLNRRLLEREPLLDFHENEVE